MGRPAGVGQLPTAPAHDVLVAYLAASERRPIGWAWSCTCGAAGYGWPSEDAADDDADAHLDAQVGRPIRRA